MRRGSTIPVLRRRMLLGPKVSFTSLSPVSSVYGISAVTAAATGALCIVCIMEHLQAYLTALVQERCACRDRAKQRKLVRAEIIHGFRQETVMCVTMGV